MQEILRETRIRLKLSVKIVAEHLKMSKSRYIQIEKIGIKNHEKARETFNAFLELVPESERPGLSALYNKKLLKSLGGHDIVEIIEKHLSKILSYFNGSQFSKIKKSWVFNQGSSANNLKDYLTNYHNAETYRNAEILRTFVGTYCLYEKAAMYLENREDPHLIVKRYLIIEEQDESFFVRITCPKIMSSIDYEEGSVSVHKNVIELSLSTEVSTYKIFFKHQDECTLIFASKYDFENLNAYPVVLEKDPEIQNLTFTELNQRGYEISKGSSFKEYVLDKIQPLKIYSHQYYRNNQYFDNLKEEKLSKYISELLIKAQNERFSVKEIESIVQEIKKRCKEGI